MFDDIEIPPKELYQIPPQIANHGHNHSHNHNHNNNPHHHCDHAHDDDHENNVDISTITILLMVMFSVGYMACEPNLDGFNIEEALEFITNAHIESIPVHVAGYVTSFIANLPMLAAIIYCWVRKNQHHEHHSFLEEAVEFAAIGGPFALMGAAAYLDTTNELFDVSAMSVGRKALLYTGGIAYSAFTGFGAYKLHGFHVHDAMEEHGGGLSGFLKGLYATFVVNVFAARNEATTISGKTLAILNEAWKKYGIVAVHCYLGLFAAEVFLKQTGLKGKFIPLDLALKILLPVFVTLYEGNTEARSLDSLKRSDDKQLSYPVFSRSTVFFSGALHTIPSLTALAMMFGSRKDGPGQGILYNALEYLAATALLAYPSIFGFGATTIEAFDKAAKGMMKRLSGGEEAAAVEHDVESQSGCCKLLCSCGFFRSAKQTERTHLVTDTHSYASSL